MESLYDILMAGTRLAHAYENWLAYREALTGFMLAHTKKGAVLHVAGAGLCNDIDAGRLAAHAGELILSDIDTDVVREGLQKQGVTGSVRVVKSDYLGVPEKEYRALDFSVQTMLMRGAPGEETEAFFLERMEGLLKNALPDRLPAADTAVASGVHSQLLSLFPRMAFVYARYAGRDPRHAFERAKAHNARLMPAFTEALYGSVCRNLVLGLEKERLGAAGGVEGAFEALADLSAYRKGDETELLWPLDKRQGKIYRMSVTEIIKS